MKTWVIIFTLAVLIYVLIRTNKMEDFTGILSKARLSPKLLTISPRGVAMIKKHESLASLQPNKNVWTQGNVSPDTKIYSYRDAIGVWTIGYGHTTTAKSGQVITAQQAEELLKNDLKTAERAVKSYVTTTITQGMYDALVSFTFNVGSGNLQKSTLLKKVNANDFTGAAAEFSKWNKAGGKELAGLTARRIDEKTVFTA